MSHPTGDPALIRELNEYLGRELGRRANGRPIFSWMWSEEMFWPAFATGRKTVVKKPLEIPLIGGGKESVEIEEIVPEYRRDRQVRRFDTWYVTKWLSPEHLIFGWFGGHGHELASREGVIPDREGLVRLWESRFPGAEFPSEGWIVPTDAYLPRSPQDPKEPNWADTRHFITQVKHQSSQNFDAALQSWMDQDDAKNERQEKEIGEEARECFTAFLNPTPGKRGGFISFPWSRQDRLR